MKTEKDSSRKVSKALRKDIFEPDSCFHGNDITLCLRALVAKTGFTLIELLTAIVVIIIMLGVLMPALAMIKKMAKDTKQKAQIASIEIGIENYKQDNGEYPPSHGYDETVENPPNDYTYCGAQTLTEAMFGQDFLGFHPDSMYRANGCTTATCGTRAEELYPDDLDPDNNDDDKANLEKRKDPYLTRENIGVFTAEQIYGTAASAWVEPDRYMICDVFTAKSQKIGEKTYKIGTPVLYFRANPSAINTQLEIAVSPIYHRDNIYDWLDNSYLLGLKRITDKKEHWLAPYDSEVTVAGNGKRFYGYIGDPLIPHLNISVRPDSFLLISAGNDSLFGTKDDICNFDPNLPS